MHSIFSKSFLAYSYERPPVFIADLQRDANGYLLQILWVLALTLRVFYKFNYNWKFVHIVQDRIFHDRLIIFIMYYRSNLYVEGKDDLFLN